MKAPRGFLLLLVAPAAVVALYAPALSFSLMGDDYQWLQHAQLASHRLVHLFTDLDSFYRPTTTWTLALDRLLWGQEAFGYHLTNVLLHAFASGALVAAAQRLGLEPGASVVVGLLWGVSPFAEESAVSVAIRFEDLLLLCWLALALGWPSSAARRRSLLLGVFTVLAMLSKETWIATPALVLALEWGFSRKSLRASVRKALPFLAAAAAYAGAYFIAFPGDKSYFRYDLSVLVKVPHSLAAFWHLESPVPLQFPLTWKGGLAVIATAALVTIVVRKRHPAGVVGAALLFAPMFPTLFVPYLPSRYLVVPYAGFLLLVAGSFSVARTHLRGQGQRLFGFAGAGVAALVLLAHLFTVRADLRDWARVSAAHARLLAQAEKVRHQFPLDRPVAVIRADGTNVLRDITLTVEGWPKLFYVRKSDPAGLIDAAALFQWVLAREDLEVRPVPEDPHSPLPPGAVLLYQSDGFHWLALEEQNLAGVVNAWRERGFPVKVIQVRPLPRISL